MSGRETILQICQDVADAVNLPRPSSIISTTDALPRQFQALLYESARELREMYAWPQLTKEYLFNTVTSQAAYALPDDFEKFTDGTAYDRSFHWEMYGPLTPQEWQFRKSGIVQTGVWRRFRFKGRSSSNFTLEPTPSNGTDQLVFEYQSCNWLNPKAWVTSTAFAAGTYCSNSSGIIYYTTSGGTTGSTEPTHSSGTVTDGGILWTYKNENEYQRATADTDVSILNSNVLKKWLRWKLLRAKGLDYAPFYDEALGAAKAEFVGVKGSRTLYEGASPSNNLVSQRNLPDTLVGF